MNTQSLRKAVYMGQNNPNRDPDQDSPSRDPDQDAPSRDPDQDISY